MVAKVPPPLSETLIPRLYPETLCLGVCPENLWYINIVVLRHTPYPTYIFDQYCIRYKSHHCKFINSDMVLAYKGMLSMLTPTPGRHLKGVVLIVSTALRLSQ